MSAQPAASAVVPFILVAVPLIGLAIVYAKRTGMRRMPSNPQIVLPLILFLALPVALYASDGQTPVTTTIWATLVPALVTVLVPLVIALTKTLLPKIPKWMLPILAPLLGVGLSLIGDAAAGQSVGVIMGAVYGGLGTWLREFIDQLKKLEV